MTSYKQNGKVIGATYVMMTCPRKYIKAGRKWLEYFEATDCHKWIIALEHGKGGLEHWQIRFKARGIDSKESKKAFFDWWKMRVPEVHIEFSENWCDYERKEGNFVCSDDNWSVLRIRFGQPSRGQRELLYIAESQTDRQVDVWYDPKGNHGKSWLSIHLFERGQGLLVPRYCASAREISNFICSTYRGQRYIIIDIPRAGKIKPELYEVMEEIKDGIVSDPRYVGRTRNVRGAKLLVFTNQKLDEKMLSRDRWRLHGMTGVSYP